MKSGEKDIDKRIMMISDHVITFPDDYLIIHKSKVPYEDNEWNALLKDNLLNQKWSSSYHVLDTESIHSDKVVQNLYGLNINNDPILDS